MKPQFMQMAIDLALQGIEQGHGPFGAVIVRGDELIGIGTNRVTSTNDPTAHAEVCAIRHACEKLNNFSLTGLEIYSSCEPCPMCLGAIYWSRLDRIYYGATREDAAKINFDDQHFYDELNKDPAARTIPMISLLRQESLRVFDAWMSFSEKIHY